MAKFISNVFLAFIFALWVIGTVVVSIGSLGNVASGLHLIWSAEIINLIGQYVLIACVPIAVLLFFLSIIDLSKNSSNSSDIQKSKSFGIAMMLFVYTFGIGVLLLVALLSGRVISLFLPEPLSMMLSISVTAGWVAFHFLHKPRHA